MNLQNQIMAKKKKKKKKNLLLRYSVIGQDEVNFRLIELLKYSCLITEGRLENNPMLKLKKKLAS